MAAAASRSSLALVGVVALAARLVAVPRTYDIFIDEVTYARISMNVAEGHGVVLWGHPFFLHPPAGFALYGAVDRILAFGGLEQTVFGLRYVSAVCGAGICILTYLVVSSAAGRRAGVAAGLLVAVDPFALHFDGRVMLEAPAQLAVISTIWCITRASQSSFARRRCWVGAAGVAAAAAVTTKETFGLVLIAVVGTLALTKWVLTRRESLAVLALAAIGYATSAIVTSATAAGGFSAWWSAKLDDVLRAVGAHQETGFNAPSVHVSLASRVFANGPLYATSYLMLAIGAISAVAVLTGLRPQRGRGDLQQPDPIRLLLGLWTLSAAAYLGYATVFGSIEEQMYYILLAPAAIACVLVTVPWLHRHARTAAAIAVALAVFLSYDTAVWASVHATSDDEYRQLMAWEPTHARAGTVISVTDYTSQFFLQNAVIGEWPTIPELIAHRVQYVLLSTKLVEEGYGLGTPEFLAAVSRGGRLAFSATGASCGRLEVWDVTAITGAPKP